MLDSLRNNRFPTVFQDKKMLTMLEESTNFVLDYLCHFLVLVLGELYL